MTETLFIVNPVAGGKRGFRRWKAFEAELRRRNFRFHIGITNGPGHAGQLSESAARKGCSVVAFGGDGTLNEVLNGFMQVPELSRGTAHLGYVPAGSSNDFLRSLGVSYNSSLEGLVEGDPLSLDVGKIDCQDCDGNPAERYFLVNASVGVLPGALEFFNRQRFLKLVSLDLAVIASGFSSIISHRTRSYQIRFDGSSTIEGKYTNLSILKGIWFGGGMSYGTGGKPSPGEFSVIGIDDLSKLRRAMIMPRFYTKTILNYPAVWKRTCSQCDVISDSAGIVEADGELVGFLPARFTVLRNSVEMIVWKTRS